MFPTLNIIAQSGLIVNETEMAYAEQTSFTTRDRESVLNLALSLQNRERKPWLLSRAETPQQFL